MPAEGLRFFAPLAWVGGAWAKDVLLEVDGAGLWSGVQACTPVAARQGATLLPGPVVPGLVNAHSHAFQRAMAGLTERRGATGQDDFWSWRDRMYSAANRVTPQQLEAIAAQLYTEMLAGGYTHVCEFHYLHNDVSGHAYADPLEMSMALVRAARLAGIGLTLLPTLYMRSGFGAAGLRDDQRRFASTPDSVLRIAEGINRKAGEAAGLLNAGVALHSLRAVGDAALNEVAAATAKTGGPIHIHISEQTQEVTDSVAHSGQRPIEWLLDHAPLDAHWNLVHATHTTADELKGVQSQGAAIVICPTTEANLGDGVFDLPGHAANGVWSIGSDSHVSRHAMEELRLLEYSQRLALRQRNVAAHADGRVSTAAALFDGALAGGAAATSLPLGGLAPGNRADFAVVDAASPALLGVPADHLMDAMVFSSPAAAYSDVYVAGKRVAPATRQIAEGFTRAMQELWAA